MDERESIARAAIGRLLRGEVLNPGDDFSETLHSIRTQHLHEKEVKRGFNTPTETGTFWVRGPSERVPVERVSNMDDSWIEDYESANFHPKDDLSIPRPARGADRLASVRVAMRFRSRRAARE